MGHKRRILIIGMVVWIVGLLVTLSAINQEAWLIALYVGLMIVMGPITFVLYGIDKRRAQAERWRISENTLHIFELFGGWLGAIFAQRFFRHKTRDKSYLPMFWGIVVLHGVIIVLLVGRLV